MFARLRKALLGRAGAFAALALFIEFVDELVDGVSRVATPMMRDDLSLSYEQIGLLYGLPSIFAVLIEPFIGVAGDSKRRAVIVVVGAAAYAVGLLLIGASWGFLPLLLATMICFPGSGASVNLAQASLMDIDPEKREQNMARWALSGSLGNLLGPMLVGAAVLIGLGWREVHFGLALALAGAAVWAWRMRAAFLHDHQPEQIDLIGGVKTVIHHIRRGAVIRWLLLLEASDLMLDVFRGFMALYFIDVVRTDETTAGIALIVFTGVGLVGDALLIPLLERVRGLTYLRWSAAAALIMYPLMLIVPWTPAKLALIGLLGLGNAGWYSILQAKLYEEMPENSGSIMALDNIVGIWSGLIPVGLGALAGAFGLEAAMWALLIAPVALLIGIPRQLVSQLATDGQADILRSEEESTRS